MAKRTRIKVCGVRDEASAIAAVECGADALGFVFHEGSPRYIDPDEAYEIACFLPPFVSKVALVVDATPEILFELGDVFPFDMAQLHGKESPEVVRSCRAVGCQLIKAFKFEAATINRHLKAWSEVGEIDALLIDGSSGGEGVAFDWGALAAAHAECVHPLIVAGGLTPENVGEAVRAIRPYAVDVSSGVESERGVKDAGLIAAFCEAVREADAAAE